MTKAVVMSIVLVLMIVSSWLMTLKSRRILSRSLGRDVRAGEETSLRAWMAVPDAALAAAPEQIGANPAEHVLGALGSIARSPHEPVTSNHRITPR